MLALRPTRALIAAGAAAALLGVAGCAEGSDAEQPGCARVAAGTVGITLAEFSRCLADGSTMIVQDASPRVGEAPSYRGDEGLYGRWIVVAACASDAHWRTADTVEVAVVPVPFGPADANFSGAVLCSW